MNIPIEYRDFILLLMKIFPELECNFKSNYIKVITDNPHIQAILTF